MEAHSRIRRDPGCCRIRVVVHRIAAVRRIAAAHTLPVERSQVAARQTARMAAAAVPDAHSCAECRNMVTAAADQRPYRHKYSRRRCSQSRYCCWYSRHRCWYCCCCSAKVPLYCGRDRKKKANCHYRHCAAVAERRVQTENCRTGAQRNCPGHRTGSDSVLVGLHSGHPAPAPSAAFAVQVRRAAAVSRDDSAMRLA